MRHFNQIAITDPTSVLICLMPKEQHSMSAHLIPRAPQAEIKHGQITTSNTIENWPHQNSKRWPFQASTTKLVGDM